MKTTEDSLEQYMTRLRHHRSAVKSNWESDDNFVRLAMALWPTDMEASALGRDSNRSRMRLRFQGYQAITQARQQVDALHAATKAALATWKETT